MKMERTDFKWKWLRATDAGLDGDLRLPRLPGQPRWLQGSCAAAEPTPAPAGFSRAAIDLPPLQPEEL